MKASEVFLKLGSRLKAMLRTLGLGMGLIFIKFMPGSPTYNKVLHLKQLMEARGAVFPAPSPKEIRESRGQK